MSGKAVQTDTRLRPPGLVRASELPEAAYCHGNRGEGGEADGWLFFLNQEGVSGEITPAYSLSCDKLRHFVDPKDVMGEDYPSETFRVLKNNEIRKHGENRTQRLALAAYDKPVSEGIRPRVEGYR